jgi:hypothetical protein
MGEKELSSSTAKALIRAFLKSAVDVLGDDYQVLRGLKNTSLPWFKRRLGLKVKEWHEINPEEVLLKLDAMGLKYNHEFEWRLRRLVELRGKDAKGRAIPKEPEEEGGFKLTILGDEYEELKRKARKRKKGKSVKSKSLEERVGFEEGLEDVE